MEGSQYRATYRRQTSPRGIVAVELALVLPILMAISFSVIEWGFVVYNKAVITNASREGARFGVAFRIPARTAAQIQTVASNACTGRLIAIAGTATCAAAVTAAGGGAFAGCVAGAQVSVTVTHTYTGTALLALYQMMVGPVNLAERTVMECE